MLGSRAVPRKAQIIARQWFWASPATWFLQQASLKAVELLVDVLNEDKVGYQLR